MASVRFGRKRIRLPGNPVARIGLGMAFVGGGLVGFLPILGFWMLPVGLLILSVDIAPVRRFNRRGTVWIMRRWAVLRRPRARSA